MKKMDELTKVKLIFSGELLLFGIVFIVLGVLELTHILHVSDTLLAIFKWVTIFGASYIIFDFVYSFANKKKREKVCLLDKISTIPAPIYIITIDILFFANNQVAVNNREYFIGGVIAYLGCVYLLQAVYHWFYPLKELLEEEETKNEEKVEESK